MSKLNEFFGGAGSLAPQIVEIEQKNTAQDTAIQAESAKNAEQDTQINEIVATQNDFKSIEVAEVEVGSGAWRYVGFTTRDLCNLYDGRAGVFNVTMCINNTDAGMWSVFINFTVACSTQEANDCSRTKLPISVTSHSNGGCGSTGGEDYLTAEMSIYFGSRDTIGQYGGFFDLKWAHSGLSVKTVSMTAHVKPIILYDPATSLTKPSAEQNTDVVTQRFHHLERTTFE